MACEESRPCIIQTFYISAKCQKIPASRYSADVKYMKCSNIAISNMRAIVKEVTEVDDPVKLHR